MLNLEKLKGDKIKNIIFISEGGLGKVIASTAVVKRLAEEFPDKKIIVVTGFPDVFQYNPHVAKTFRFDNPLYFYDDYINPECFIIKVEPYVDNRYIFDGEHLIDVWCKVIGIDSKGAKPEMFFLENEIEAAKIYTEKITMAGKKKFVLLQWVGGIVPKDKTKEGYIDSVSRMHRRSIPQSVAQKLANKLISRGYVVGVVQHDHFPDIQGIERVNFPVRSTIALLKFSDGFIGIDSFLQHASAAMDVKGVVLWGGTNPSKLGYKHNLNLTRKACPTPFCHRPDSYVFDSNNVNGIWNCPHNAACMGYDADEIVQAFEEHVAKKKEKSKPAQTKTEGQNKG